jgi:hypothetical protein
MPEPPDGNGLDVAISDRCEDGAGRYRLASVCGAKKQRIVKCGGDVQM